MFAGPETSPDLKGGVSCHHNSCFLPPLFPMAHSQEEWPCSFIHHSPALSFPALVLLNHKDLFEYFHDRCIHCLIECSEMEGRQMPVDALTLCLSSQRPLIKSSELQACFLCRVEPSKAPFQMNLILPESSKKAWLCTATSCGDVLNRMKNGISPIAHFFASHSSLYCCCRTDNIYSLGHPEAQHASILPHPCAHGIHAISSTSYCTWPRA